MEREADDRAWALSTIWFYGAVLVSVLLIAATAVFVPGAVTGPAGALLGKLALSTESNPAAWWSSMLLLVVSLHAYDGYAALRQRRPDAAMGWALIALVLLALSIDEISSLHERVRTFGRAVGVGPWLPLLPFAAILGAMLGRALLLLWSAGGEQRRSAWRIVIGCLLLGTVVVQEFLERRIAWQSDAALAIRAAVEEGTELVGILVLLGAAMSHTAGLAGRDATRGQPAFAALEDLRRAGVLGGLALTPVLALFASAPPGHDWGHPADWLAAGAYLAATLAICRPLFARENGRLGRPAMILAALCAIASVATVDIDPLKMVGFGSLDVYLRPLVLGPISLLIAATWLSMPGSGGRTRQSGAGVLGVLALLASLVAVNPLSVHVLSPVLALVTFWVNGALMQQATSRPLAGPTRQMPIA